MLSQRNFHFAKIITKNSVSYIHWTEDEKDKLLKIVHECRNSKNEIDWDVVLKSFPERTKQQLKSMYQNVLKPQDSVQQYHKWKFNESVELFAMMQMYGSKSMDLIQENYFQSLSKTQIKSHMGQIRAALRRHQTVVKQVLNGEEVADEQYLVYTYNRILAIQYVLKLDDLSKQGYTGPLPELPSFIITSYTQSVETAKEILQRYPPDPAAIVAIKKLGDVTQANLLLELLRKRLDKFFK